MKIVCYLALFLISTKIHAQEENEALLQITGSARVAVKPDIGVLNIHVSEIKPKMNQAIEALGDKSNYYLNSLKKLDFAEKDIKTASFAVSKNRIYRNQEYVDSGYVASQDIRLEFKYDERMLSKILNEFAKSEQEINFSFVFKLSEELKDKVQEELIDLAVEDTKQKALNIAASSNLKLVKIKRITYGRWGGDSGMEQIEREYRYAAAASGSSDIKVYNFTPDDLLFRDSISIDWEIEE